MFWSRHWPRRKNRATGSEAPALYIEALEDRTLLDASAVLSGGVLTITGGTGSNYLTVLLNPSNNQLQVLSGGHDIGNFSNSAVTQVTVNANGAATNVVHILNNVLQTAVVNAGPGTNIVYGGGGTTMLNGGSGNNKLVAGTGATILTGGSGNNLLEGGSGSDTFAGGSGANLFYNVKFQDTDNATSGATVVSTPGPAAAVIQLLSTSDVSTLLQRAAGAANVNNAIIAIVDRAGNLLGVRVESGVASNITSNPELLSFAIDGAIAEARTGAFFGNNEAPLTSRTVQFISQTTITEQEVNSYPFITDANSTARGPGFVAPIGIGGSYPPGVANTPGIDLFGIEATNRDGYINPGPDGIIGTSDDIQLPNIYNVPAADIPAGQNLVGQPSYGYLVYGETNAVSRGIATLPGGIPIVKFGQVVGGIGVFFPGTTGFASAENSALSSNYNPKLPDLSEVAEYMAYAAVGGSSAALASVGNIAGIAPLAGFDLPFGEITLNGVTLPLFGPGGTQGPQNLLAFGKGLGVGNPNDGTNVPIDAQGDTLMAGKSAPTGVLVTPHAGAVNDGQQLTAADVQEVINQAIQESATIRAAIRLGADGNAGVPAEFVIAVTDTQGNLLGLYREPDATIFSIDVAVAKARNVAYYDNPALLQPIDQLPGVAPGVVFTNETFNYLAQPRYPEGDAGAAPGVFSILNTGGVNNATGMTVGNPLPASAFQTAFGYNAFNPGTNFHDPYNLGNQNGIVFFPGSIPLYKNGVMVGAVAVSGDGVTQDNVETYTSAQGYLPPSYLDVDNVMFKGVRLPMFSFTRNVQEG